jgi:hypothetical protein
MHGVRKSRQHSRSERRANWLNKEGVGPEDASDRPKPQREGKARRASAPKAERRLAVSAQQKIGHYDRRDETDDQDQERPKKI